MDADKDTHPEMTAFYIFLFSINIYNINFGF